MKDQTVGGLIDYYFEKVEKKEMDFSSVRKELEEKELEPDDINAIVRQVDRQLIRAAEAKGNHIRGKNEFLGGIMLTVIGVALTAGTYTGAIDMGNYYLVAYGPIFGGMIIAMIGRSKMKKN